MASSRLFYLVSYKTDTKDYMGWIHCIPSVAKFLDIDAKGKTLTDALGEAKIEVKGLKMQYRMPDGTTKDVNVKDFTRSLGIANKPGGKKIIFQTGEVIGKSKRKIHLRASPNLPNLAIIDALAGIIPDSKVKYGDQPGATEIARIFTIGASQYMLMKYATGSGTATPTIPAEEATIVAVVAKEKGKTTTP